MRVEEYKKFDSKIEKELSAIYNAYAFECEKLKVKPADIVLQTRNPKLQDEVWDEYGSEFINVRYDERRYIFVLYGDKNKIIGYIQYLKNLNHLAVLELRSLLIHPLKREKGAGTFLIKETMKILRKKHIIGDCMIIQIVHKLRHLTNPRKNMKTGLYDFYQKIFNNRLIPIKKTRRIPLEQYFKIYFI